MRTLLIVIVLAAIWRRALSTLGTIFGLLYDDAENALSFQISGGCQFAQQSLVEQFSKALLHGSRTCIPAGRTGLDEALLAV